MASLLDEPGATKAALKLTPKAARLLAVMLMDAAAVMDSEAAAGTPRPAYVLLYAAPELNLAITVQKD